MLMHRNQHDHRGLCSELYTLHAIAGNRAIAFSVISWKLPVPMMRPCIDTGDIGWNIEKQLQHPLRAQHMRLMG